MESYTIPLKTGTPQQKGPPVRLDTPNFLVRSLTAADVTQSFAEWFNNPLMLQGLNLPPLSFSVDGLRAFVASFDNRSSFLIGIFAKESGKIQGFFHFMVNCTHRIATLTLGMEPDLKNARSILWETTGPLCEQMFEHHGLEKVSARVLATNRRILFPFLNNSHFVVEGVLKQECLGINGKRIDVLALACFKDLKLRPHLSGEAA